MGVTQVIGQGGEALARQYLEQQGYVFITANWRCKGGELDLLMWAPIKKAKMVTSLFGSRADKTLAVIEVRTRSATDYGSAHETITLHKQQKIIRATQWYQQSVDYWGDIQFDVIAIDTATKPPAITHIPHAFAL